MKVALSLPQVTDRGCSAQPPESGVARPRQGLQGSKLQIRQCRAKHDTVQNSAPLFAQRGVPRSPLSLPLKLFLAKMGVDFLIPRNPQLHVVPRCPSSGYKEV